MKKPPKPELSGYVNFSLCRGTPGRLDVDWYAFMPPSDEEVRQLVRFNAAVLQFIAEWLKADAPNYMLTAGPQYRRPPGDPLIEAPPEHPVAVALEDAWGRKP